MYNYKNVYKQMPHWENLQLTEDCCTVSPPSGVPCMYIYLRVLPHVVASILVCQYFRIKYITTVM